MAEQQEMIVETRLGRRSIDAGNVLYFPRGIAGFEGMHRFVLLRVRPDSPMVLLQSLDNAELGLLVTNPFAFCPDYPVRLSTEEAAPEKKPVLQSAFCAVPPLYGYADTYPPADARQSEAAAFRACGSNARGDSEIHTPDKGLSNLQGKTAR